MVDFFSSIPFFYLIHFVSWTLTTKNCDDAVCVACPPSRCTDERGEVLDSSLVDLRETTVEQVDSLGVFPFLDNFLELFFLLEHKLARVALGGLDEVFF